MNDKRIILKFNNNLSPYILMNNEFNGVLDFTKWQLDRTIYECDVTNAKSGFLGPITTLMIFKNNQMKKVIGIKYSSWFGSSIKIFIHNTDIEELYNCGIYDKIYDYYYDLLQELNVLQYTVNLENVGDY
jgi:hypothetical protein